MEDEPETMEKKLPTSNMESKHDHPGRTKAMGVFYITNTPNGTQVNSQSILKRVHGLCNWVCSPPPKKKSLNDLRRLFCLLNLIFILKNEFDVLRLMSQPNGTQL